MLKKSINRREFALGIGASALASTFSLSSMKLLASTDLESSTLKIHTKALAHFVSAGTDKDGKHYIIILDNLGAQTAKLSVPARAHQVAVNPLNNELAVAARRPGTYLMIVDSSQGKILQEIQPEPGLHFYGHSVYSEDGRFLFTTENHIESGEGRIFVRDALSNYRVVRSFSSFGIGPHELRIHPDKKTLIVANGGILTHPDTGRAKLNLDTMSPSLVYISIESGQLIEQRKLPENLNQLSIRHIDVNSKGDTAIAMQYQGDKTDNVPLIALHQQGKPMKMLWAPEYINRKLKNYCGSVCFNKSGSIFAVTAPRGNTITIWDSVNAEFICNLDCLDVCGISQSGKDGFSFSNGLGKLYQFDLKQALLKQTYQDKTISWDNHLSLI